jgi:hypothetical protein
MSSGHSNFQIMNRPFSNTWAKAVAQLLISAHHVINRSATLGVVERQHSPRDCEGARVMKSFMPIVQLTQSNRSLTIALGQRLIRYGFYLSSLKTVLPIFVVVVSGVVSVAAQTPSGSFFDGNSAQLGNSLRSVTFFLAAAMIIAGIIFIAVGIITSGLRESLSTWKFITGAACFAFGGICAAVYAFSQGETVPLDNQF